MKPKHLRITGEDVPAALRFAVTPAGRHERDHVPASQCATTRAAVDAYPEGMSLTQIGQVLGISKERVRQIEEVALVKLKIRLAKGCADE